MDFSCVFFFVVVFGLGGGYHACGDMVWLFVFLYSGYVFYGGEEVGKS